MLVVIMIVLVCLGLFCFWKRDTAIIQRNTNQPEPDRELQKPIEIRVLATDQFEHYLSPFIEDFNSEHQDYQIIYEQLPRMTGGYEDAVTAINLKILSKEAPDVLFVNYLFFSNYMENGVLADISEYMRNSSSVKRENYFESVLGAFSEQGGIYGVPRQFSVSTLLVRKEGENQSTWTVDEFVDYWKQKGPIYTEFHEERNAILDRCLQYGMKEFVDVQEKKSYLDEKHFHSFMESIYGMDDNLPPYVWEDVRETNEEILVEAYYNSLFSALFTKIDYNGEMYNMGYPSSDGNLICKLMPEMSVGIMEKSKCKEGAWAVVEAYLNYEFPFEENTLPANKKKLMDLAATISDERYVETEDGELVRIPWTEHNGVPIYSLQQKDIDEMIEAIDAAKPINPYESMIRKMIEEETPYYFRGDISLDECIDKIQSRVKIYLVE